MICTLLSVPYKQYLMICTLLSVPYNQYLMICTLLSVPYNQQLYKCCTAMKYYKCKSRRIFCHENQTSAFFINPSQSTEQGPLDKPIFPSVIKNFPHFMESKFPFPYSNGPSFVPVLKHYTIHPPIIFLKYCFPSISWSSKSTLSSRFPHLNHVSISSFRHSATRPSHYNRSYSQSVQCKSCCSKSHWQPLLRTVQHSLMFYQWCLPAPATPSDSPCLLMWSHRRR
jgi:hypothetical protein